MYLYRKVCIGVMFLCAREVVVVSCGARWDETWCGSNPCCIFPVSNKLGSFLFASIYNPIKTHVYGFGSALFDGFIDNA